MKRNPESLATDFYTFLRDPLTLGGSYKAKITSPGLVEYEVYGIEFRTKFIGEYQCTLRIHNLSEELVGIPYDKKGYQPNWTEFLEGIFALTKQRLFNRK